MIIHVPIGNIVLELGPRDTDSINCYLSGKIIKGTLKYNFVKNSIATGDLLDAMFDALENILLAHAIAGIDVTSPEYLEGLETAIDACTNAH